MPRSRAPLRDYLTGRERLIYDEGYDDGFRDAAPSRQYLEPEERRRGTRRGQPRKTARRAYEKRRPSAYAKAYGVIFKRLKKKHPRASFGGLSKKAHAATRKKRGMKKGKK